MNRKIKSNLLIVFFLLVGLVSCISPFICTFFYDLYSTHVIIDYEARELNYHKITQESLHKKSEIRFGLLDFQKNSITNRKTHSQKDKITFEEGDMLGYITIPRIDSLIPIYEGKTDAILQKGVGHLKQDTKKTCLPFLGKNKNCVLAGHSGLSSARLFSDLDKLSIDDVFYIRVRSKYYEYKVIEISINTPDKAEEYLQIEKGKDICTLVTCTPVPLNSHRLLVKGERIKYDGLFNRANLKERQINQNTVSFFVCIGIVLFLFILLFLVRRKGKRK